jgi:hypothetical protein
MNTIVKIDLIFVSKYNIIKIDTIPRIARPNSSDGYLSMILDLNKNPSTNELSKKNKIIVIDLMIRS